MAEMTSSVPASRSGATIRGGASTIVEIFRDRVRSLGNRTALRRNVGGQWAEVSWAEYGAAVDEVAAALTRSGVEPGDRVGVLSVNRLEWHVADVGTLCAGGVTVPVYQTSSPEQVEYILGHSSARVCFVEDAQQLTKVLERRDALDQLARVVVFDATGVTLDDFVTSFDALRAEGREHLRADTRAVEERATAVTPDDLATIVYTSGTTGPPKGAMITHANIVATVDAITAVVPISPDDRFLSFLPLSHIAERTVSHFGQIVAGGETWFARSLATLPEDLPACRPTIFFAVPRVWQKIHDGVLEQVGRQTGVARELARRYFALGPAWVASEQGRAPMPATKRVLYRVLDRLVGAKIRARVGLDRARVLVSGAAPVPAELLGWLHGVGLRVGEVYGQTEDCGPTTLNPPERIRIGTVGPPLPTVEVRIDPADGEILVRGPNVCRGYFRDEPGTRALIDDDGWMHSGDTGSFDEAGYLVVTGRKKDLIITAQGKNIAPQEIETRLQYQPLISQAVVIGEGRPYLTALLTLDADDLAAWTRDNGKQGGRDALADDPALQAAVQRGVERVNEELSRPETIRKWRILPRDFSVESGEMTPTMKVKRSVVGERYRDEIEEMYAEPRG